MCIRDRCHTMLHQANPDDNRKRYNASCQHGRQYQILPALPYGAGSYNKGGQQNPSHHRSACLPIDGKDLPGLSLIHISSNKESVISSPTVPSSKDSLVYPLVSGSSERPNRLPVSALKMCIRDRLPEEL